MDTGRAIVQTAQLGIIFHAACNAWGNAIITFFMPFDPAPYDKKSHSEHQTLFPLFGEGHKTKVKHNGDMGMRHNGWDIYGLMGGTFMA